VENFRKAPLVTVPGFYIGKYEVTQGQWMAVMDDYPSPFEGDNFPVRQVSWKDAKEFCLKLSQMTGKKYRLPSEAEWEYACRAGSTGPYAGNLNQIAWYVDDEDSGKPHPVGQLDSNDFGLFDMHGDVWEWCEDVWHDRYGGRRHGFPPTDGSTWLTEGNQKYRVVRGGSWRDLPRHCRSANRHWKSPSVRHARIGFRVAMSAKAQ
jgi:formylglycine-generating enzyme required for sulfatase activity